MPRISAKFQELRQQKRVGLIAFLTVGFPEIEATLPLVRTVLSAGADMIELGVPFSDPLADGATLQAASFRALEQGVTLGKCLEVAEGLRVQFPSLPIILMSYYNPIIAYGIEPFARRCAEAEVDGLIVVDLPPEEADTLYGVCRVDNIDLIPLLAPTSTEDRILRVTEKASGFIYCVSVAGVTGAREQLASTLPAFIARVRGYTRLPLAVGFGIARPEQVEAVGQWAEAVVVGSALAEVIESSPLVEREKRVQQYIRELKGNHY
ncbi:MAG: tryptophan synthase subunit alpha [Chloroflexi bacterium]|nr:tryptophan synthase subunit alpha [Chloroflexota bacterium]